MAHGNHKAKVLVVLRRSFVACATTAHRDEIRRTLFRKERFGRNMIVRQRLRAAAVNANIIRCVRFRHSG